MKLKHRKAEPGTFHTTYYKNLDLAKPEASWILSDTETKYSVFKIRSELKNSKSELRVPINLEEKGKEKGKKFQF